MPESMACATVGAIRSVACKGRSGTGRWMTQSNEMTRSTPPNVAQTATASTNSARQPRAVRSRGAVTISRLSTSRPLCRRAALASNTSPNMGLDYDMRPVVHRAGPNGGSGPAPPDRAGAPGRPAGAGTRHGGEWRARFSSGNVSGTDSGRPSSGRFSMSDHEASALFVAAGMPTRWGRVRDASRQASCPVTTVVASISIGHLGPARPAMMMPVDM